MKRSQLAAVFYGRGPVAVSWATESPVKFDVWLDLAKRGPGGREHRADLILSVSEDQGVQRVLDQLYRSGLPRSARPIAASSFVAVQLTLPELIRLVLPMTSMSGLLRDCQRLGSRLERLVGSVNQAGIADELFESYEQQPERREEHADQLRWFLRLVSTVVGAVSPPPSAGRADPDDTDPLDRLLSDAVDVPPVEYQVAGMLRNANVRVRREREGPGVTVLDRRRRHPVVAVTMNRQAVSAVSQSRKTVKADAAEQVFSLDCSSIGWAVLDSGIDAEHPAFANYDPRQDWPQPRQTRVMRAFDLVDARRTLAVDTAHDLIDWSQKLPAVELQLDVDEDLPIGQRPKRPYQVPNNPHGTHIAGIIGGHWPEQDIRGICSNIQLYDFRVLDRNGKGNEFSIIAAMQAIRYINEEAGRIVIAGANISVSVPHDVAAESCGWTPVCVEAERLVRSGVVVVTAAGNAGFVGTTGATHTLGGDYRNVSISDPGNADGVITVGSTHRVNPHRHGVSYFSGRGPTADGRLKPDLVAPGEDIDGPVPDEGIAAMHGTSQAAAHVSGAAAMLVARHRELLGRPERVKEILCATATDLRRERSFQGHGLVDVLRAMQSL